MSQVKSSHKNQAPRTIDAIWKGERFEQAYGTPEARVNRHQVQTLTKHSVCASLARATRVARQSMPRSESESDSEDDRERKRSRHERSDKKHDKEKKKKHDKDKMEKKHDKERKHKDKKHEKREKHDGGEPAVSISEPITEEDYFSKAPEFASWLQSRGTYLDELQSDEARKQFGKFVKRWNGGELPPQLYAGVKPASRTRHQWGFVASLSDADLHTLDRTKDGVDSATTQQQATQQQLKRPAR